MTIRARHRVLATAAAAALALTACGGDAAEDATGTGTEPAVESPAAGESPAAESPAPAEETVAPLPTVAADAEVRFAAPEDGATVSSPVEAVMEATNVTVEPAGEIVDGAGHFHIMVDVGCLPVGEVIPNDDQHLHFGDGSTTAMLELEAGEHTLCLQLGDGAHRALDLTHEITITVE